MNFEPIPEHIKRFILRSVDSVSHLEAMLLMRYDPGRAWDIRMMAQGLFISEKKAAQVLIDLCSAGFAALKEGSDNLYFYKPLSNELADTVSQLSEIYSKNLIEVTNLIHSKTERQAQQFGDAFMWDGKDTDS